MGEFWRNAAMTNEKESEPGAIDEGYDMQAEVDADYQRMSAKEFAFCHLPPPGIVDYSQLPSTNGDRYHAIQRIFHDIDNMADADFYLRYHSTKEEMRHRVVTWRLLDEPTWCADELLQVFMLHQNNMDSREDVERRISNAQYKGLLGRTFTPSQGIQWLNQQRIKVSSEFSHLWYPTYDDSAPVTAPSIQPADSENSEQPDTTGKVAWQAATIEAWPEIVKALKPKPTARKVLRWLRDNGPSDVFPRSQEKKYVSVEWIDGGGNWHTLTLNNLSNRISEWKSSGDIPR